ncbi:MAG: hypothetical protein KHX62_07165, partial [Firmicutes bacterium]|nr:hypothetical protein [Bacillota bacterium]
LCFDFIRKCLSYQALSAFVRLRRVSETGSLSTIPNFIKESLLLFFSKIFYHAGAQNASHSAAF